MTNNHAPLSEPFKEPLTVNEKGVKKEKAAKGMLANGRNKKSMPSIDEWFAQVKPLEIARPEWKALSKTATDVYIICKAKAGRAAKRREKDKEGQPKFAFTVSEAKSIFTLPPPTFTKAIKRLLEIGFIERIRSGGIVNGNGITAEYRLSEKWKSWQPPPENNSNMDKARAARKQNPNKGALSGLS